jgi:hypothetical protein
LRSRLARSVHDRNLLAGKTTPARLPADDKPALLLPADDKLASTTVDGRPARGTVIMALTGTPRTDGDEAIAAA